MEEGDNEPDVVIEHTGIGEIDKVDGEQHVSQGHEDQLAPVPLLRLELPPQDLISLVLLLSPLLPN